jgi:hypothetical protein
MVRVQRPAACVAALLALAAGLGCRYGLSGWWAKCLGVALWATELYLVLLVVRPGLRVGHAAGLALLLSWAVEAAQLTPIPAWLSAQHVVLRLIFGTTFSLADLPAYAAGVGMGIGAHAVLLRARAPDIRPTAAAPGHRAGRRRG